MGTVMEIRTDNINFQIAEGYVTNFVMGVLLMGLAFFFYIRWKENWAVWRRVFDEGRPTLEPGPSAIDITVMGCGGLVAAILYLILTIVFFSLGIDQLLKGKFWTFIDGWLRSLFPLM